MSSRLKRITRQPVKFVQIKQETPKVIDVPNFVSDITFDSKIIDLLTVYEYKNKIRLGNKGDGGYVIADNVGEYDLYLSAGIGGDESFSKDFLQKYNIQDAYAFDGTISRLPSNFPNNMKYIPKNISIINNEKYDNLHSYIDTHKNIFVKMDIEGFEIPWILSLNDEQLQNIKQIAMEFHGINNDSWHYSYQQKYKAFEKLLNTHYIIHAHGNNHAGKTGNIPDVIEVTFLNKNCFISPPKLNTEKLPCSLDFPNSSIKPEINLNFPPFTN